MEACDCICCSRDFPACQPDPAWAALLAYDVEENQLFVEASATQNRLGKIPSLMTWLSSWTLLQNTQILGHLLLERIISFWLKSL